MTYFIELESLPYGGVLSDLKADWTYSSSCGKTLTLPIRSTDKGNTR
jgi:hypothetical protein